MKSKLVLAVAAALFVLPTKGRADTLTITELSSQSVSVSLTVFGQTLFTNQLFQNNIGSAELWGITPLPQFGFSDLNGNQIQDVAWIEPEDPTRYNLVMLRYHGSQGTSIQVFSDVTSDFLLNGSSGDPVAFYSGQNACISGGSGADCPILANNASIDVPIFAGAAVSTLTVTFNDLGEVATPLPSTWLMLLSGFVGLGLLAYRGTKKRTAFAAA